jgi:hypothetical protein
MVAGQPVAHAPPPVPHAAGLQVPLASQQPLRQLVASHRHLPPLHRCPPAHVLPHAPQFALSVDSSTHPVAQTDWVPAQARVHAFPSQAAVPVPRVGPGQLVPQAEPQLFGSLSRTHAPLQECASGLQTDPHVVPLVHVALALAGAVHAPQAAPSWQWVASLLAAQVALAPVPQR